MLYKRLLSKKLEQAAQHFPCVVLTGARQVGKTTLLRHLFPHHHFVSLDLPSLAEQAESEPEAFLKNHPPPLLIDEVQYAPRLFRNLKIIIDQNRHAMGQFILTGSQKFTLMKEVSDSLAGRAAILSLDNLSAIELALKANASWAEVLVRGFYPELWRQKELDHHQFYSSYLSTYLERDVRQILNVHSLRDFERFLRACAARSGQLLNMSDLARDVGIKPQTARDWLSVLEASNQISLLEPYFENVGKRIVKSPKLFLNDSGLLCFLLGLEPSNLASSPLSGAIWETFVYAEFRKAKAAAAVPGTIWYYRDDQARELDFIWQRSGALDLYECKWSESPDPKWQARLEEIAKILARSPSQNLGEKIILCRTQVSFTREGVRTINPVDYFGTVKN